MKQNSRNSLLDQMLNARTKQEVEAAEKAARRWLEENPGDVRVIAAQERLDETRAKLEDKERRTNKLSLLAFVATSSIVGFLTLTFSGTWVLATAVGLVIGLGAASEVWQQLHHEKDLGTDDKSG